MKRIFGLVLTLFTLVMVFSSCSKGKPYLPQKISGTVTFRAENYHCKGDFLFEKEGIKRLTLSEPSEINGTFVEVTDGLITLSYDGVSAEINGNSPVRRLFAIAEDFTSREHKIPLKGIEIIKGTTEEGSYEIEFNCYENRITEIKTEEAEYIFQ